MRCPTHDRLWPGLSFTDTTSGTDVTRPQLAVMLGFVRDGDTVIVYSMDRLARNLEGERIFWGR